jgi:hypothetical protein
LPEVDAFIGLDQVGELGAIAQRVLATPSTNEPDPLNLVTRRPTYIRTTTRRASALRHRTARI